MDDVLVLAKTHDEHLDVIEKVFTALEGSVVQIKYAKSQYFTKSVGFLGHVLSNERAQPNLQKVRVILEARSCSNGLVEPRVIVIIQGVRKVSRNVKQRFRHVLLHHRNTPHSVMGIAPAVSSNGRVYVTKNERINPLYTPESCSKKLSK